MGSCTTDAGAREELRALMESRAHVYDLLSRCFETEVTPEFAESLAHAFAFETDDEALAESFAQMRAKLDGIDADGIERLAVVFDRVFFGMGPRAAQKAFPYESVYTSDRGIMMQDAYSEATRLYRTMRLRKNERFTEPEDHLAVELAFMALCARQASEALATGDEDAVAASVRGQAAFLEGHLLNWLPRFCADLRKGAEEGFYLHLADFLLRFAESDRAFLRDLVGQEQERGQA
ncbi:molecular chaperone [Adlercreutzia sp. ZJ473]|uniref:TorD/DmsD family molecular chaperone n=1 Tax=Adlercreutzia sp. ZJ473 TaxID=2722822 RepID=UPI0020A6AB01|nr:molecular chaperone TorD family protein [Adlercreutzia sp. ZJ473]